MKVIGVFISFMAAINFQLAASIVYYNSSAYDKKSDSPFYGNSNIELLYVEDFESIPQTTYPYNFLSTPNATGWNGSSVASVRYGVKEDYENNGEAGSEIGHVWTDSWRTPGTTKLPNGIHFDFTPDEQGRFPEYVGAALLGRYDPNGTGLLYNSIFVYDKDGNEVTGGEWKFVRPPESEIPADPADYFLNFEGIYVPGGISRILFRDFLEVDHLTYGYSAIPEPAATGLAAAGVLGLGLSRRRRQT